MKAPRQNHPLKDYNTFGLNVTANQFYQVDTIEELSEAIKNIKSEKMQHLILGGGSNILFTSNYNGAIIHPSIDGVETIDDTITRWCWSRVGLAC
jgi:UDP-N-acetylmuramate dehydrogenase